MALVIKQEAVGNIVLVHTYSNEQKKIKQVETGVLYDEAFDMPNRFTYEETNIEASIIVEPNVVENESNDNV